MNEKWVHTCIHTKSTGPQSNTHARTHTCILVFLQRKLVLINLAGGTRHVFPFTSWPVPWVAQSKPSILVCLQFVCLNFLLICIIHWWPVGLAQEVLSEDCRGIYFTQTSYIIFSFSFSKKKKMHLCVGPPPSASAFKNERFWCFEVFLHRFSLDKSCRRRGLSARSIKTRGRCTKHLWLCDYEGQMFFSHTATLWAAYNTAYHPLDNFVFLPVSEGP